jgi:hypothetical protein
LADGTAGLDLKPRDQFLDEGALARQDFPAGGGKTEIGNTINLRKALLLA